MEVILVIYSILVFEWLTHERLYNYTFLVYGYLDMR